MAGGVTEMDVEAPVLVQETDHVAALRVGERFAVAQRGTPGGQ